MWGRRGGLGAAPRSSTLGSTEQEYCGVQRKAQGHWDRWGPGRGRRSGLSVRCVRLSGSRTGLVLAPCSVGSPSLLAGVADAPHKAVREMGQSSDIQREGAGQARVSRPDPGTLLQSRGVAGWGRRRRAPAVTAGFTSHSCRHKILFPDPASGGTRPGTSRFCFLRLRCPAEKGGLGVLRSPSSPSQRPYAWRRAKHEGSSRRRRLGCFSFPQGLGATPQVLASVPCARDGSDWVPKFTPPTSWAARVSASLHRGWVLASLDPRPRSCPGP